MKDSERHILNSIMHTEPKIVAVSGGFDPLHIGHVRMFAAAKELGDRLVVIVNNDNWLRKKKGFVFMPQEERVELIKQLAVVDDVVLTNHDSNDDDTSVCRLLSELRPSVFANGGDRGADNIPEYAVCGELGIDMAFNVGDGGKVQSSSWMIAEALESVRTTERPWGSFKNHHSMPGVHLKTLHVKPDAKLSLQRHKHRSETWVLVAGEADATIGESLEDLRQVALRVNEPFYVPAGTIHRLSSVTGGTLVEIAYGQFDENDIERLEDIYGRA